MSKQLAKYLRTRATTAPWQINGADRKNFQAAIIIPALEESQSLPKTLASLTTNPAEYLQQTLIIIVVNNRAGVISEQLNDNQQTLAWLQTLPFSQLNLAWVDASSPSLELPDKEGVGLARKIGFDLALSFLDWREPPLLISLDADTLVDENYLPAIARHFAASQKGGATIPFRHQTAVDPQQKTAIRYYELYLRSYLFGLQQAGSPYAYHTIGSAFACRATAYVNAGGMNRRHAAEDFYFLQNLAKSGGIEMLRGTIVQPSARFSGRVPFGTGKAVQVHVEEGQSLFQFSSRAAFSVLQAWLDLITAAPELSATVLLRQAGDISPTLRQFLVELNFAEIWQKLQVNHSGRQRLCRAFNHWFDALRTRQLLTRLDRGAGCAVEEAVEELLQWGGYPGFGRQAEQLVLLESLQHAVKI